MVKELVTFVVKQLVEHLDDIQIRQTTVDEKNVIEIVVNEADRGKVIGREGQTIKAIRMIVNATTPDDQRINVDVAK